MKSKKKKKLKKQNITCKQSELKKLKTLYKKGKLKFNSKHVVDELLKDLGSGFIK